MIRARRLRTMVALAAVPLPKAWRRWVYIRLLGHEMDPSASVGRSFVDVDRLTMGPDTVIGNLTVIRGCERVLMERDAYIGSLNLINGLRRDRGYFPGVEREPALVMRELSRIFTMHYIDCADRVELSYRAGIVGLWSVVLTHAVNHHTCAFETHPVTVGVRSVVMTRCTVLPGAAIGDCCIVAAGTVVPGTTLAENTLYGGGAAKPIGQLDPTSDYFQLQAKRL